MLSAMYYVRITYVINSAPLLLAPLINASHICRICRDLSQQKRRHNSLAVSFRSRNGALPLAVPATYLSDPLLLFAPQRECLAQPSVLAFIAVQAPNRIAKQHQLHHVPLVESRLAYMIGLAEKAFHSGLSQMLLHPGESQRRAPLCHYLPARGFNTLSIRIGRIA